MRLHAATLPPALNVVLPPAVITAIGLSAALTALSALTMPAPHWPCTQAHSPEPSAAVAGHCGSPAGCGNAVALDSMRAISCERRQIRVDRAHQRGDSRDDGCGKAGAEIVRSVHHVRVAVAARHRQPEIDGRVDGPQAGGRERGDAIARRRADAHLGPQAAVSHLGAYIAQPRHREHAAAIAGRVHRRRSHCRPKPRSTRPWRSRY